MTRLTVQDMRRAIEEAAEDLITAAGPDGMVSREDIQQKLAKRAGAYRDLLEAFYNLLRDESQPYQRVTRRVIQEGVAFVREQIIGQMEVTPGALTAAESNGGDSGRSDSSGAGSAFGVGYGGAGTGSSAQAHYWA